MFKCSSKELFYSLPQARTTMPLPMHAERALKKFRPSNILKFCMTPRFIMISFSEADLDLE